MDGLLKTLSITNILILLIMNIISYDLLGLLLFTIFSAFFSGSETALFSLTKSHLHRFSLSSNRRERTIAELMRSPEKILITILVGNLFVNIVLSAITTKVLLTMWGDYGHFIAIAIVTPIIIVFCEISPKVISMNNYESFSKRVIPILSILHKVLLPLRALLLSITNRIIKILKLELKKVDRITEDELNMAIIMGGMGKVISKDEVNFMQNVLRFSKKDAQNVMIPRNRAVFIPYNAAIEKAVEILIKELDKPGD